MISPQSTRRVKNDILRNYRHYHARYGGATIANALLDMVCSEELSFLLVQLMKVLGCQRAPAIPFLERMLHQTVHADDEEESAEGPGG